MMALLQNAGPTLLLAAEAVAMLDDSFLPPLSRFDIEVYDAVVPENHYLNQAAIVIPWDNFEELLREMAKGLKPEERLATRVAHLREMLF